MLYNVPMSVGSFLKSARIRAGFSSVHTAGKAIGVSGQAVSSWESEKSPPDPKRYDSIAAAYRVPRSDLVAVLHGINQELTAPAHDFGGVGGDERESKNMVYEIVRDLVRLRMEVEAKLQEVDRRLAAIEGERPAHPRTGERML
jgi:transcriptional regulator with XRE-family HTH domain